LSMHHMKAEGGVTYGYRVVANHGDVHALGPRFRSTSAPAPAGRVQDWPGLGGGAGPRGAERGRGGGRAPPRPCHETEEAGREARIAGVADPIAQEGEGGGGDGDGGSGERPGPTARDGAGEGTRHNVAPRRGG